MKIIVLGADGYLGWPTSMHFSALGDEVYAVDNFNKRKWELEEGIEPLLRVPTLQQRSQTWKGMSGKDIQVRVGDLCNYRFVYNLLEEVKPDAIVHYAEQPSAPYSMQNRSTAVDTQMNNVVGNLNLLFAMRKHCPGAHLIKLGTMGEYGTPNIDIEEGYITIKHNGREDTLPFPKQPGSFYHLSKVHDSNNLFFACRIWGLIATDLNQGVVYGMDTDESEKGAGLNTSFHYDDVFGTVLNRFLVQASVGRDLTVYGKGGQTRGFLNIKDTLQCVELASRNPAEAGKMRVMNQFTEQFSVMDLAQKVQAVGRRAGLDVKIEHMKNPRIEREDHYYNAKHSALSDLGLKPNLLTDEVLDSMLATVMANNSHVDEEAFTPRIKWAHYKDTE
jgi:UDP-sulfoquinovose synthase